MAAESNNLIVGRKQLMVFLGINGNWVAVEKMINRQGCPIGKVGGRWSAQRHLLLAWITRRQGGAEPVKSCKNLQVFTPDFQAIWTRWRSGKMGRFLQAYRASGGLISPACREAGITRPTYYNWRKRFDRFDAACREIEKEVQGNGNNYEEAATGKEEGSSSQKEASSTGCQEAFC